MSTEPGPTGRTRLRVQRRLFRADVLVLQIEERIEADPPGWTALVWRDAAVQDISGDKYRAAGGPHTIYPAGDAP